MTTSAIGGVACLDVATNPPSLDPTEPPPTFDLRCTSLETDHDTASTKFLVLSSASFSFESGFDLDQVNNAQRGGAGGGVGPTIEGCNRTDLNYGRDAEFAKAAQDLATVVDLDPALAEFAADARLELRLTHLTSEDVATDPCVGAELRVGGETGGIVRGHGSLANHVASISFRDPVHLPLVPELRNVIDPEPGSPPPLVLRLDRPMATILFDPTNATVRPRSFLGGITFFEDSGEGFDVANATGFARECDDYASDTDSRDLGDLVRYAFANRLDLRLETDGALSRCSAGAKPNAISVAIALSSEESP